MFQLILLYISYKLWLIHLNLTSHDIRSHNTKDCTFLIAILFKKLNNLEETSKLFAELLMIIKILIRM